MPCLSRPSSLTTASAATPPHRVVGRPRGATVSGFWCSTSFASPCVRILPGPSNISIIQRLAIVISTNARVRARGSVLRHLVVRVAVQPALTDFGRGDHGMPAGARVPARMTVRRAVATQRGPAFLAGAQMHPLVAALHALLADPASRRSDGRDRDKVRADWIGHGRSRCPFAAYATPMSESIRAECTGGARESKTHGAAGALIRASCRSQGQTRRRCARAP